MNSSVSCHIRMSQNFFRGTFQCGEIFIEENELEPFNSFDKLANGFTIFYAE